MITKEIFEYYVGRPPENDDLERCNCPLANSWGHTSCGWSKTSNLPRFIVGPMLPDGSDREIQYPTNSTMVIDHDGTTSILGYLCRPLPKSNLDQLFTEMYEANISAVQDVREYLLSQDVIKPVQYPAPPPEIPRELKLTFTIDRE